MNTDKKTKLIHSIEVYKDGRVKMKSRENNQDHYYKESIIEKRSIAFSCKIKTLKKYASCSI